MGEGVWTNLYLCKILIQLNLSVTEVLRAFQSFWQKLILIPALVKLGDNAFGSIHVCVNSFSQESSDK